MKASVNTRERAAFSDWQTEAPNFYSTKNQHSVWGPKQGRQMRLECSAPKQQLKPGQRMPDTICTCKGSFAQKSTNGNFKPGSSEMWELWACASKGLVNYSQCFRAADFESSHLSFHANKVAMTRVSQNRNARTSSSACRNSPAPVFCRACNRFDNEVHQTPSKAREV